jgi:hypothetical protein
VGATVKNFCLIVISAKVLAVVCVGAAPVKHVPGKGGDDDFDVVLGRKQYCFQAIVDFCEKIVAHRYNLTRKVVFFSLFYR